MCGVNRSVLNSRCPWVFPWARPSSLKGLAEHEAPTQSLTRWRPANGGPPVTCLEGGLCAAFSPRSSPW